MQPALRNVVLVTAIIGGFVMAGPTGPAAAAPLDSCYSDDNGSPFVDDVMLSTDHVDVSSGAQSIAVTVTLHDTGGPGPASGISYVTVRAGAPSGVTTTGNLTDQGDGTWGGSLVIPQWSVAGTWQLTLLSFADGAEHHRDMYEDDLADAGLQRPFSVVSVHDHTPPKLTGFTVTPSVVDTRTAARPVTVTAKVTDAQSGVSRVLVWGYRTGTHKHWRLGLRHTTGNLWSAQRLIPTWSGLADWTMGTGTSPALIIMDRQSNYRAFTYGALGRLGFRRDFSVLSRRDRAYPTASSVTATPHTIDARTMDQSFTITVKAADVGSGVRTVVASGSTYHIPLHLVSGTPRSGTWSGVVHVLRCSAASGSWSPWEIGLRDGAETHGWVSVSPGEVPSWPKVHVTGRDLTVDFPTASIAGPGAEVTLTFDESVNGITNESALLAGGGVDHPGTWTCFDANAASVDCLTGWVREARFNPDTDLVSGESYVLLLDPEGVLALTDLAGNPFTQFHVQFDVP